MIGKVIEGLYSENYVYRDSGKSFLYIQADSGEKVELTKRNVMSIEDITAQYSGGSQKVLMVMWNNCETSILQLGYVQKRQKSLNPESDIRDTAESATEVHTPVNSREHDRDPEEKCAENQLHTGLDIPKAGQDAGTAGGTKEPKDKAVKSRAEYRTQAKPQKNKIRKQPSRFLAVIAVAVAMIIGLSVFKFAAMGSHRSMGRAASQSDFLEDMSEGIKSRIAYDKDTKVMSEAEKAEYYAELVNCELEKIGKYSGAKFPDDRFSNLAHQYINACEIQLAATENYKNADLYNAMWSGGLEIRSAIIVYFYENHNLDLTEEEVASYRPSDADYTITVDSSGGNILDAFSDKNDVKLSHGDLTVEKYEGEITNYGFGDEYCNLKYVLKNNSSYELNMASVHFVILDADKNILTTTAAYAWATIPAGKTVICEGSFNITDYPEAKYVQIEYLSYDGDGDHTSHNVYLTDAEIERYMLVID